ncbi:ABC transporter substrate-binding protein [Streptomyces sp. NPDC059679]|uniref:ABC transporter substrate-binding protein n=1 Tax=Streptomyces sp. NPDC059679 TaxID=3346903 RepID=UPI0036B2988A
MNTPPSPPEAERADGSSVRIGALVPLTRPGWVEAGQHLLAGLELAVREVNDDGGIVGRPLELVVRDTAADPQRAAAAVDELARLGVAALAGEYHSVVARAAAARADALGLPFLCSSAVLDGLTEQPTDWVARLAPAQSHGWRIYTDFLLGADRERIAECWPRVAVEGTRGQIRFSRTPGISVWQWAWTPVQVVDRDPAEPDRFRILHTG